jgi:hypothetical protein
MGRRIPLAYPAMGRRIPLAYPAMGRRHLHSTLPYADSSR